MVIVLGAGVVLFRVIYGFPICLSPRAVYPAGIQVFGAPDKILEAVYGWRELLLAVGVIALQLISLLYIVGHGIVPDVMEHAGETDDLRFHIGKHHVRIDVLVDMPYHFRGHVHYADGMDIPVMQGAGKNQIRESKL